MIIEQINLLTVSEVEDILIQRLLDSDDNLLQEDITQLMLEDELAVYKTELVSEEEARIQQELLDSLILEYNSIKRVSDISLVGNETIEQLETMIETIKREISVEAYTNLTLTIALKPELTLDMDSNTINSLIETLEAEEVRLVRKERVDPVISYFKKHVELAIEHKGEQQKNWITYIERELYPEMFNMTEEEVTVLETSMSNHIAKLEAEAQERALQQAAEAVINRSNEAMKYIVSFNMSKISSLELDSAGLDALEVMFSEALTKIQNMRPDKAADIIELLDLTGTVYTEVERTELLNILRGL